MKKQKTKTIFLFLFMLAALFLQGCNKEIHDTDQKSKTEGLDQLGDIQVISREEGSGTRNAFAQIAGFLENQEEKPDLTTSRAQIVQNPEEVCEIVRGEPSAIGYLSMGTVPEDQKIKTLKVNGKKASTKEKAYPLCRTFYLAYSGQKNELKEDFLTYVHSKGQEIIAKKYTPVAKSSTFLSNKAKGTLKIGGSTSIAPLMEELAKEYEQYNPNAAIQIESTDSTKGLTNTMSNEYDLGMSSRDLKDYEMELLDYEAIAIDDIAVIVNEKNPLEDISIEDLKQIFTGQYVKWEELNQ